MNYDYLTKIRGRISLYTKKKTSNLLEGDFRSVYRGRSLEFDDLREYTLGDNVRDIDWKSSSRTGKMLVRRYVAEKRHNILLVGDSGLKMCGDTPAGESKADIAVTALGVLGFLADRHSDDFALLHSSPRGYEFSYFRSGAMHFETLLHDYDRDVRQAGRYSLPELLSYISENIRRRMVICVITDLDGLDRVDERLVKTLTVNNDLLLLCLEDAYLTEAGAFNLDAGDYEDPFFAGNTRLREAEERARRQVLDRVETLSKRYRVPLTSLSDEESVVDRIVELFDRTKEMQT